MLCQKCNEKKATVHLTKIVNNKKNEMHLCEDCARRNEEMDFQSPFAINNFLTGLLDSIQSSPIKVDYIQTTTCSKCGMNYGRFKQLGRLGCSECYKTFNQKLTPLIKRIHGSENHIGKVPKRAGNMIRLKRDIMNLRKDLTKSVESEDYETAAELRDKIKNLEKDLHERE